LPVQDDRQALIATHCPVQVLFESPRIFFGKSGRLNFEVGPVTTG
jgi:hypothetical protein